MEFSPEEFERRLSGHAEEEPPENAAAGRSAVAMILRDAPRGAEVLLMVRAEVEGDPWSGQICLPGGRHEPGDPHLLATAVRETHEEVGLDLQGHARQIARLATVRATVRGRPLPMTITPYLFRLEAELPLRLGIEAVDAFWLPLARAARGEFDAVHAYRGPGGAVDLPCWRFEERVVWGLTHRMLSGLLRAIEAD